MSRSLSKALFVVSAGLLFSACATGGSETPRMVTLGQADEARTVTVAPGTPIEVQLAGNPGTGYRWEVAVADPAILRQLPAPPAAKQESPSKPQVGVPTLETFRFESLARGVTRLQLDYRRAFEKDKPALKSFVVTVQVK